MSIDHNIDAQSVFSWAPELARKCESKHWFACDGDVRSVYGHVITIFSGMGCCTYPWCSAGTRESRARAPLSFSLRWLNTVLRAVSGNLSDSARVLN